MRRVLRNDGKYYGISDKHGSYYVSLYDLEGKEVSSLSISFMSEEEAYIAACFAADTFAQGQKNALERQQSSKRNDV